jgi:hypothetical protein
MATGNGVNDVNVTVNCQRCGGRMIFEKFYDVSNVFFGWHCVMCGEILDPVILLHRLSQDADLRIPEKEEEILDLVRKYMEAKSKPPKYGKKRKEAERMRNERNKISLN